MFSGLFFSIGGQDGRHTEREGTEENATDDIQLVDAVQWSGSIGSTVLGSKFVVNEDFSNRIKDISWLQEKICLSLKYSGRQVVGRHCNHSFLH